MTHIVELGTTANISSISYQVYFDEFNYYEVQCEFWCVQAAWKIYHWFAKSIEMIYIFEWTEWMHYI